MNLAFKAKTSRPNLFISFKPKVNLLLKKFPYTLKTIETQAELEAAFKLRSEVFFEQTQNEALAEFDYDDYDPTCDHIAIYDDRSLEIVGTYRVRSTKYNQDFYSEQEFKLEPIFRLPGNKLELGRACVRKEYRNGTVISLLWRGIANYAIRTDSNFLFGCSSVFTTDFFEAAKVYVYLKRSGFLAVDCITVPTEKYQMHNLESFVSFLDSCYEKIDTNAVKEMLPTLFSTYLKMGAKVCGEPALDMEFKCIDFLTVLDLEKLNKVFRKFQE